MRAYLKTMHTRSDKHKRHVALLISAGCTLLIFSVWSFVHFTITNANTAGTTPDESAAVLLAPDNSNVGTQPAPEINLNDTTPLENLKHGISELKALLVTPDGTNQ